MSSPTHAFLNGSPIPTPKQVSADTEAPPNRHIEVMGRALDDVVGSFLEVAVNDANAFHTDVQRLAAAARRLWKLASDPGRARRTDA